MPFMRGPNPIRRTWKYLEAGDIYFRERPKMKIMLFHFNSVGERHDGMRQFLHWKFPQLAYKNLDVQMLTLKNRTPSPCIRVFYETGEECLLDVDDHSKEQIWDRIGRTFGKADEVLAAERRTKQQTLNPANFGGEYEKHCICEVPGQVPCPGVVILPKTMRGKFVNKQKPMYDTDDEAEQSTN